MSRSEALGELKTVELAQGTIHYRERGTGPAVVFVHGALVNGDLWRDVVPALAPAYRCIALDLPLGSHQLPARPEADLTPRGLARLVSDALDALDARDVTLVGNDTGGAICQLVVAHHPARVARLVLTNCDAFEHFPPPLVLPFAWGGHVPGFVPALAALLRLGPARRLLYGLLARRRADPATLDSYFAPLIADAGVRRDLAKVLRGVSNKATLEAARLFPSVHKPVLLAWGEDDILFPLRDAERLARAFPDARLVRVPGARAFVPEDQPAALAQLIAEFARGAVAA
jgi:pimeloyl-ACP methyl ester carboxylesterase